MSIVIDIERDAINAFKVMISSDEVNCKKSTTSIILKIDAKNSKILFHNVVDVFDLIINFEMKSNEYFDVYV